MHLFKKGDIVKAIEETPYGITTQDAVLKVTETGNIKITMKALLK